MQDYYRTRRAIASFIVFVGILFVVAVNIPEKNFEVVKHQSTNVSTEVAADVLETLPIKGRAPKTDYSRDKFGSDWNRMNGCDTRNIILNRDLYSVKLDEDCNVTSGVLDDPYTGKTINFKRGSSSSGLVQIDHVVALSDAWQKGAQSLTFEKRKELANDPLELLAVDGSANQQKGAGDAATWLPKNKSFRCQYIARQIAVKQKYLLWVTSSEKNAMQSILKTCPKQMLPSP